MSTFDIVFLVIIGISLLLGLLRGFVTEIFAIGKWVLAVWITLKFGHILSAQLATLLPTGFSGFSDLLSRVVVFVLVLVILMVLESMISSAAANVGLGPINRLFGGILGIVRGIILCVVVVWLGALAKQEDSAAWKSSKMMPLFTNIYDRVLVRVKDNWKGFGTLEGDKAEQSAEKIEDALNNNN